MVRKDKHMNTELFSIVNQNAERLERKARKEIRDKADFSAGLITIAFLTVCILLTAFVETL
jgi:hypothetical protein